MIISDEKHQLFVTVSPEKFLSLPQSAHLTARQLNRERIQCLHPDREVQVRGLLQDLQNNREMYEDGILLLNKFQTSREQTHIDKALEKLLEGLKGYILLQESLFETGIDESSGGPVSPAKLLKQEVETAASEAKQEPKQESDDNFENNTCLDFKDEDSNDETVLLVAEEGRCSPLDIKLETLEPAPDKTEIDQVKPKRRKKRQKGDPISCEQCNQVFEVRCKYLEHMRRHRGEKPFKCDQCFKEFTTKGNMKTHMDGHKGERSFQCDLCAKKFLLKSDLKKHMRIHSGEKPHKCEFCYMGFATSGNLIRHRRTHTGEKPYSCDLCDKSFADVGTLNQHKRSHTGEKPFQCHVCSNRFAAKKILKRHMKMHLEVIPYQCEICEKMFSRRENLSEHMNLHNIVKSE